MHFSMGVYLGLWTVETTEERMLGFLLGLHMSKCLFPPVPISVQDHVPTQAELQQRTEPWLKHGQK